MADNNNIPDVRVANHILSRMGEIGQPPEQGIQYVNVGNEEYLDILRREYLHSLLTEARGSAFKLVQGYFGGGKTHFLHCVRDLAWSEGFFTAMVSLSRQSCPFDDPHLVYRAVADAVTMPPVSLDDMPVRGLPDVLRAWTDTHLQALSDAEFDNWLRGTALRLPVRNHNFRRAAAEFIRAYRHGDVQGETVLECWLHGDSVTQADVKRYGVFGVIDRTNAFQSLCSLAQVLKGYGAPGLVLMFDEVDRNLSLITGRQLRAWVDNLRQVVDMCGGSELPGVLFLYAVPPEFMRNVVPDYPALDQRLSCPLSMSLRSPQAALIDLENLSLEPFSLLEAIGKRLLDVAQIAWDWKCDRQLQERNASFLADKMSRFVFESGHRRQFVKAWISFLHSQHLGEEVELSEAEAMQLITNDHTSAFDGAAETSEAGGVDDADDDDFSDF